MKLTREQIERARIDFESKYGGMKPKFNGKIYLHPKDQAAFLGFLEAVEFYQPQSIFSEKEGILY